MPRSPVATLQGEWWHLREALGPLLGDPEGPIDVSTQHCLEDTSVDRQMPAQAPKRIGADSHKTERFRVPVVVLIPINHVTNMRITSPVLLCHLYEWPYLQEADTQYVLAR